MMGKTKTEPWFVMERAESLLVVHLTRRDDLKIERQPFGSWSDYLVHIHKKKSGRIFGVSLMGQRNLRVSPTGEETKFPLILNLSAPSHARIEDLPFCFVVFDIDDNNGFYRWFREPAIDAEGRATLVDHEDNRFAPFDRPALDHIVHQVNQWYDQRTSRN